MKKICIISHIPTHPTTAGNQARIINLVNFYRSIGLEVHYILLDYSSTDKDLIEFWGDKIHFIQQLPGVLSWIKRKIFNLKFAKIDKVIKKKIIKYFNRNYLVNYHHDAWYPFHLEDRALETVKSIAPDYIQVEYLTLSRILLKLDKNIITILDTHDMLSDRNLRFKKNTGFFSISSISEKIAINRSDNILAITEEESKYFRKLTKKSVHTVGHLMPIVEPLPKPCLIGECIRFGFLGSNNLINIQTYKQIVSQIESMDKNQFSLLVSGRIINTVEHLISKKVIYKECNSLNQFYSEIDVVLNPTINSTGLKIKNIEALYYGKVLITSIDGSQGLRDGINSAFICLDNKTLRDIVNIDLNNYARAGQKYIIEKITEWENNLTEIFKS